MSEPTGEPAVAKVNPLLTLLHTIVDRIPWRAEAETLNAHAVLVEEGPKFFGTPAGVQKPVATDGDKADTSNPDTAPFGGTDPSKDGK